jgi:hypothetical protein
VLKRTLESARDTVDRTDSCELREATCISANSYLSNSPLFAGYQWPVRDDAAERMAGAKPQAETIKI